MDQQDVMMLQPIAPGKLYASAFSPDSRRLATSIREFRLFNLDLHEQKVFRRLGESAGLGISAAFHPSGDRFAGGNDAGGVHVFTTEGKDIAFRRLKGVPLALLYADNGRRLLVAGWENAVYSWDPEPNDEPKRLFGPLGKTNVRPDVSHAAFSPDGRWLAFAERGGTTAIWNVHAGMIGHTVHDAPTVVTALAFDRTGRFLAVGSEKGEIQIHDVSTAQTTRQWNGHPMNITGLSFTPDGSRLASASGDGNVKLWD